MPKIKKIKNQKQAAQEAQAPCLTQSQLLALAQPNPNSTGLRFIAANWSSTLASMRQEKPKINLPGEPRNGEPLNDLDPQRMPAVRNINR
jgi:hypothetical protein